MSDPANKQCPNKGCVDGSIAHGPDSDGHYEQEQCQWCDENAVDDQS